jgi:hypothetical protein
MQAEVDFLQFAARAAPGFTPELIQVDSARRCVVLEHLEGKAFPEGVHPPEAAVSEAVEFFRQLNAHQGLAKKFIHLDAAEGFLSLLTHLCNVQERLQRMTCVHLGPNHRPQAEALLRKLHSLLAETEKHTSRMIDRGMVTDAIDPDQRCISPSDFGFHNAIQTEQGTYFIDFEFAGWDDPAKAAQDFILQPRVPITKRPSPLIKALPQEQHSSIHQRCEAIGPILRLKWVCIQLAVLQPARLEEILVAVPDQTSESLIQKRLEKASHYLRTL